MKTHLHIFKRVIISCVLLLFVVNLKAQGETKKEQIEALRVAFITKEIGLTTDEAKVFWPVYNEYLDKLEANRKAFRKKYDPKIKLEFKTDKEAEDYITAETNLKTTESALYKEYNDKFKKVLSVKKVALLRQAEERFKKELVKQLKNNAND